MVGAGNTVLSLGWAPISERSVSIKGKDEASSFPSMPRPWEIIRTVERLVHGKEAEMLFPKESLFHTRQAVRTPPNTEGTPEKKRSLSSALPQPSMEVKEDHKILLSHPHLPIR